MDKETKSVFAKWCGLINRSERYYLAKAMDLFYELPSEVQFQMLRFFLEDMKQVDRNKDKLEDSTQYPDVIRNILHHYSGREDAGQPSKKEFGRKMAEFLKSSHMREAAIVKSADGFMDELNDIKGELYARE